MPGGIRFEHLPDIAILTHPERLKQMQPLGNFVWETLRDKQKIINEVYLYLETTRGGWVGERRDRMYEFKPRSVSDNYDPIQTITGLFGCHITSSWNKAGTFIVQQRDPLPMSILNAIPSVTAGGV